MLSTSVLVGKYEEVRQSKVGAGLNTSYVDTTATSKTKTPAQNNESIDHKKNEANMEKALMQAVQSKTKRLEMIALIFDQIIKVDPYYGKVLKQIKRVYDNQLEECTKDSERILTMQKEITLLKSENEVLKEHNANMTAVRNTTEKESNNNFAATRQDSFASEEITINPVKEAFTKPKNVFIPRLDLTKITNKYEKVTVPKLKDDALGNKKENNNSNKLNSSGILHDLKGILKEQTTNEEKPKYKGLSDLYAELCAKQKYGSGAGFIKYKKGL